MTLGDARGVVTVTGKGSGAGKTRTIPVDKDYIARWDTHVETQAVAPGGWMFFSRRSHFVGGSTSERQWIPDRGKPASSKAVQNLVGHLSQLAQRELDHDLAPTFKLTPKVFRRTYACTQVILHAFGLGGMDLVSLQAALGHSRLDTTRVYLSNVANFLNTHLDRINTGAGATKIVEHLNALHPDTPS